MSKLSIGFKKDLSTMHQDLITKIDNAIKDVNNKIDGICNETQTFRNLASSNPHVPCPLLVE